MFEERLNKMNSLIHEETPFVIETGFICGLKRIWGFFPPADRWGMWNTLKAKRLYSHSCSTVVIIQDKSSMLKKIKRLIGFSHGIIVTQPHTQL